MEQDRAPFSLAFQFYERLVRQWPILEIVIDDWLFKAMED